MKRGNSDQDMREARRVGDGYKPEEGHPESRLQECDRCGRMCQRRYARWAAADWGNGYELHSCVCEACMRLLDTLEQRATYRRVLLRRLRWRRRAIGAPRDTSRRTNPEA